MVLRDFLFYGLFRILFFAGFLPIILGALPGRCKERLVKTAVVIEIKSCTSTDELLNAQKVALEQIKEKKYAESYIKDSSIDHVYAYAIAFSNKYCRVKVEALK